MQTARTDAAMAQAWFKSSGRSELTADIIEKQFRWGRERAKQAFDYMTKDLPCYVILGSGDHVRVK